MHICFEDNVTQIHIDAINQVEWALNNGNKDDERVYFIILNDEKFVPANSKSSSK